MEEVIVPVIGAIALFIALPWIIFHYITKWKSQATLTREDENLLDDLHDLARRLDDRMCSIERIMTAENPNWRALTCDPADTGIEDQIQTMRRIKQ
jgi:phage shock protein B